VTPRAAGPNKFGSQLRLVSLAGAFGPSLAFVRWQDPLRIDLSEEAALECGAGVGSELAAVSQAVEPVGRGLRPEPSFHRSGFPVIVAPQLFLTTGQRRSAAPVRRAGFAGCIKLCDEGLGAGEVVVNGACERRAAVWDRSKLGRTATRSREDLEVELASDTFGTVGSPAEHYARRAHEVVIPRYLAFVASDLPLCIERRGGDLNPRTPVRGQLISSESDSAALAPLLGVEA
jgi:hypothetical protein